MTDIFEVPSPDNNLLDKAEQLRLASIKTSQTNNNERIRALNLMADSLEKNSKEIIDSNFEDYKKAEIKGISKALLSRLKLSKEKLNLGIEGIRKVGDLSDPLGQIQIKKELSKGLILERKTVPIGVLGVIFESRPDAVMQISSLAIRAGNGVMLKGGSEANFTNQAIVSALKKGLQKSNIDDNAICLLTSRKDSMAMLNLEKFINLIIPRGSNELVKFIQENTGIPVLGHADGICHLYIDDEVNLDIALKVALDSKIQYPAACNAIETLLIHKSIAPAFLKKAIPIFNSNNVKLIGDKKAVKLGVAFEANYEDWQTEYLDLILSIKIVDDLEEGIAHIQKFSSKHTDGIITENISNANKFMSEIDSAGVFHNCSTRFADGFRYGFGAEVGISTQTLPPRGPVGLEGLVTYKYFLRGEGHSVDDFSSGKSIYTHKDL
ncbi:Gamma-glutamyl phosphate reductase [Prochlorococcus marinus str. MIT 9515]|uniref:Gamma-glutamyl phosphate reductase n=1 Tax=Prochlorococcus marinus (strain MIT 9515) TaxID=167542 RepID=PROA_PROM5|nr:glutamate-5-semialdehyde dehydrogenase [Prochlorococcus marinus]A2BVQ3.1 RecName: Full=Gamma-glutamyl phosphate reductase; Short=GPR; AltName: Full=Glutamate-5-semialdehyde dehydrogenase; AltName: Full=Glutamyl-gamma-semialdehyde dehydrogenase; Short=GSA dehydrogenase [Prochlorococcus marinus str. MIT 9515]ABM71864.1 Gamma-glutamyl phosphate reductase [Prochlorococcus marinus str. MIT 9515]